MKPLLKWAGGKRWLVPLLQSIWETEPAHTLIEPFTGGMSVALGLQPKYALLNDSNIHLINFYNQVKKGLKVTEPLQNEETYYYEMRHHFNHLIRTRRYKNKQAASLFYFLIRTGFNGLCRFNQSGEFNVPFGQHKKIHYKSDFLEYQPILKPWDLTHGDFEKMCLTKDALIYADPPYDVPFRQYYRHGFNWDDQLRLAEWLAAHQGLVIASNQATPRVLQLYKKLGFSILTLHAPRRIACNGDRRPALEMLALRGFDASLMKQIKKQVTQLTAHAN